MMNVLEVMTEPLKWWLRLSCGHTITLQKPTLAPGVVAFAPKHLRCLCCEGRAHTSFWRPWMAQLRDPGW